MGRKKGINRSKTGFSIEIDIEKKLNEYCDVNLINKSKLVNNQNLEESKYLLMKVASKFAISFK